MVMQNLMSIEDREYLNLAGAIASKVIDREYINFPSFTIMDGSHVVTSIYEVWCNVRIDTNTGKTFKISELSNKDLRIVLNAL